MLGAAAAVGNTLLSRSKAVPESSARSDCVYCSPTGVAIEAYTCSGIGVEGYARHKGIGVYGYSSCCAGVLGTSSKSIGIQGGSVCSYGVYAYSNKSAGVYGRSYGTSSCSFGVLGQSECSYGVKGCSSKSVGVFGESTKSAGVYGTSSCSYGVRGCSTKSYGVYGQSSCSRGVQGYSPKCTGVYGNSCCSIGVQGYSKKSIGVSGTSPKSAGVFGASVCSYGVQGCSFKSYGVSGESDCSYGVYGSSSKSTGVYGKSCCGFGVSGSSTALAGVYGSSSQAPGVVGVGCKVGMNAVAGKPSAIPIVASSAPCQTANLQQWNNSRCNPISVVNRCGWLGLGRPCAPTTLAVCGSISAHVEIVCTPYAMSQSDFAVLAYSNVTLPAANTAKGMMVFVKNLSTSAIKVSAIGTDKIEGKSSQSLAKQYASYELISDGSANWYIISSDTK